MSRSINPEEFLEYSEKEMVESAIASAEEGTSAKIKLVLAGSCSGSPEEKAAHLFIKKNLHKVEERNCVMILLVLASRELIILGDVGIDSKVGDEFWDSTRDLMISYFKDNEFGKGLSEGIKSIGKKLQEFFSYKSDDKNEDTDRNSYEE